jgi:GT2 family glycosyltransferase
LSYFYQKQRYLAQISVIIVNYNAQYFLKNCIGSILKSVGVPELEIIVVDNHSTDDSCAMLKKYFPKLKLIRNEHNEGFSKANNRGVAAAEGAYVLLLNPDTILAEDTLKQVYEFAIKTSDTGAVGVQLIDGSGHFLPESKRNFPDPTVAALKFLGFSKRYYAHHIKQGENAQVDILTGAFMFMKKSVYEKVGGFDENFFMYGEDIDLSYRISKAGYKNYYLGDQVTIHFKGESTLKNKTYFRNFYGAMRIFYKKHFKSNFIWRGLMDLMVGGVIFIKSHAIQHREIHIDTFKTWMYIGNNELIFHQLKNQYPELTGSMIYEPPEKDLETDMLFFDSNMLSYKQIISCFVLQKDVASRKRIISIDGTYYLGSDTSYGRGEVVFF